MGGLGPWGAVSAAVVTVAMTVAAVGWSAVEDPSFGTGGSGTATLVHDVRSLVRDSSGKLLAVGTRRVPVTGFTAVTRLTPDGQVDASFGNLGSIETRFGTAGTFVWDAAIDSQDRVVVGGFAESKPFVARLLAAGGVDSSFGNGGILFLPPVPGVSTSIVRHLQVDGLDRVVVLHDLASPTGSSGLRVLRYDVAGQLDSGFGTGGIASLDLRGNGDLVVDSDGSVLVVGDATAPSGVVGLRKLGSDGLPETGFGTGGGVNLDRTPLLVSAASLAVDPVGRILVGGSARGPIAAAPAFVARFSPAGVLDATFGDTGVRLVNETPMTSSLPMSLAADAAGVLVGGNTYTTNNKTLVARLTDAGDLDASFAAGGYVLGPDGSGAVQAAVLQAGGRLVVAGDDSTVGFVTRWSSGDPAPGRPAASVPVGYQGPVEIGAGPIWFTPATWTSDQPTSLRRRIEICGTCFVVLDETPPTPSAPATYTPGLSAVGARLVYTELAENGAGVTASSITTPPIEAGAAARQLYTGGFRAQGSPTVGGVLYLPDGTWSGGATVGFLYSWRRCSPQATACTQLTPPGVQPSYTVTPQDVGYEIVLVAHATNRWTSFEITAPPVGPVPAVADGGGTPTTAGGGGSNLPDLELTLTPDRAQAGTGQQLALRASVRLVNWAQSSGAGDIVLTVQLPPGLGLVSSSQNRGSGCTGATTVVCDLDFIANVIVANVDLLLQSSSPDELVVTGSVQAFETDPVPANNTAAVKINAQAPVSGPAAAPPRRPVASKGLTRAGTARSDVLRGTPYADALDGRLGADKIFGYAGNDLLTGGLGGDTIDAGSGNDTIRARDGARDTVRCGAGTDTVSADKKLDVLAGCEKVTRR